MIRTGNLWTWPCTPDKVFYELDDIVQEISPPEVGGSRLQRPVPGDLSDGGKQIVNAFPSILKCWMDRNLKLSLV